MEAALRLLLPKIIGDLSHEIYVHQCKNELLARLPDRLRGYSSWLPTTWRVVVLVDRDDDHCIELKQHLETVAADSGLITRSKRKDDLYSVVNRLAIEELEAWFFGDWSAVRAAFPRVGATIPRKASFRDPDIIAGGTWEALERVLQGCSYFSTGLRKVEAARAIASLMEPTRNTSRSFRAFKDALTEMARSPVGSD